MSYYLLSFLSALSVTTGAHAEGAPSLTRPAVVQVAAISFEATRDGVRAGVQNDAQAMESYDQFIGSIQAAYQEKSLNARDVEAILTAVEFATATHQGQKRAQGTPYVSHLFEVAYEVVQKGQVRDVHVIIAALLHDVGTEAQVPLSVVKERFGPQVAALVGELTEDVSVSFELRKQKALQAAPQVSEGAAQIQLADALYNVRDLALHAPKGWSQERVNQYYAWTEQKVTSLPKVKGALYAAVTEQIKEGKR